MALTFNFRSAQITTTASTSYTGTTNYTPSTGALLIAFVNGCSSSNQVDPTDVTGHGVTWTKIATGGTIGVAHIASVWVANSGAAPTNGAASANWGSSRTGGAIIEYEITSALVSGGTTQSIVQSPTSSGTGTAGTVTLASAGSTFNLPIAFYVHLANEATTPKSGWTEPAGSDGNFNNPATGAEVQYQGSTFETGSSATWTTSAGWRGSALEIKGQAIYTATVTTKDVLLGGSATATKTKVGAVVTQDTDVMGSASNINKIKNFVATGAATVLLAGAVAVTRNAPVATKDVLLGGSATVSKVKAYAPDGGVKLGGSSVGIAGTTKDSTGAALGNCTVKLYVTSTDALQATTTSNASGKFSFDSYNNNNTVSYYCVAYKAGSPDVAGTTLNTLKTGQLAVDIFLYAGEASPNDIRLRDPTTLGAAGSHTYNPDGGSLKVQGALSQASKNKVGGVVTKDLLLDSTAPVSKTKIGPVLTKDLILDSAGTATKAKVGSVQTQDVKLAGAATLSKTKTALVQAQDVKLSGTAPTAKQKIASVVTQDVKLDSQGTYSFVPFVPGAQIFRYAASGNVVTGGLLLDLSSQTVLSLRVGAQATATKAKIAAVGTQDLKLSGLAGIVKQKIINVQTQDIKVQGSATASKSKAGAVSTQDLKLAGTATATKTKIASVATKDVLVAGTAPTSKTKIARVVTQDVRLDSAAATQGPGNARVYTPDGGFLKVQGAGTAIKTKAALVQAQDLRLSGSAPAAKTKIATVATKDLLVQGTAQASKTKSASVITKDLRLGGSAAASKIKAYIPDGGFLVLDSAAVISFTGIRVYTHIASGGVIVTGIAPTSAVLAGAIITPAGPTTPGTGWPMVGYGRLKKPEKVYDLNADDEDILLAEES